MRVANYTAVVAAAAAIALSAHGGVCAVRRPTISAIVCMIRPLPLLTVLCTRASQLSKEKAEEAVKVDLKVKAAVRVAVKR